MIAMTKPVVQFIIPTQATDLCSSNNCETNLCSSVCRAVVFVRTLCYVIKFVAFTKIHPFASLLLLLIFIYLCSLLLSNYVHCCF
jgi:hypothetical protein